MYVRSALAGGASAPARSRTEARRAGDGCRGPRHRDGVRRRDDRQHRLPEHRRAVPRRPRSRASRGCSTPTTSSSRPSSSAAASSPTCSAAAACSSLALCVFTVASALCALAPSLGVLVGARVAAGGRRRRCWSRARWRSCSTPSRASAGSRAITLWAAVGGGRRRPRAVARRPARHGLRLAARVPRQHPDRARRRSCSRARSCRREPRARARGGCPTCSAQPCSRWRSPRSCWRSSRAKNGAGSSVRTLLDARRARSLLGAFFVARCRRDRAPLDRPRAAADPHASASPTASRSCSAVGFYGYTLCNVLFLTGVWRYSVLQAGLALTPGPFDRDGRRRRGEPPDRAHRPPRGARPRRADLGRRAPPSSLASAGVQPDFLGKLAAR